MPVLRCMVRCSLLSPSCANVSFPQRFLPILSRLISLLLSAHGFPYLPQLFSHSRLPPFPSSLYTWVFPSLYSSLSPSLSALLERVGSEEDNAHVEVYGPLPAGPQATRFAVGVTLLSEVSSHHPYYGACSSCSPVTHRGLSPTHMCSCTPSTSSSSFLILYFPLSSPSSLSIPPASELRLLTPSGMGSHHGWLLYPLILPA